MKLFNPINIYRREQSEQTFTTVLYLVRPGEERERERGERENSLDLSRVHQLRQWPLERTL